MEKINTKLPIYKQVPLLSSNFKELGIKFVYNQQNKTVYLSLLGAPTFVVGEKAQMTIIGCFKPFSYVRDNFKEYAEEYKRMYNVAYKDNPEMIKYLNK